MTIYVDALEEWGWKMPDRTVSSCHMFTDTVSLDERHAFALRIGMKRQWFQLSRVAPHYDLTRSRRDAAVRLGAIEVDRREASRIWRERRALVQAAALAPTGNAS
jgi:hypothetical protein